MNRMFICILICWNEYTVCSFAGCIIIFLLIGILYLQLLVHILIKITYYLLRTIVIIKPLIYKVPKTTDF